MDTQTPIQTITKPALLAGVSLVLGICFDLLFYGQIPGLNFFVYVLLMIAGLFISARLLGKSPHSSTYWLFVPLLFFSAMVFVRASYLLTFLNVVASGLISLLIIRIAFAEQLKELKVVEYIKTVFLPFFFIPSFFETLPLIFTRTRTDSERTVLPKVINGILISLPILLVFFLLFSSADLVFQKYANSFFDFDLNGQTIFRFFEIAFVSAVFLGGYAFLFGNQKSKEQLAGQTKNIGKIETSILLGSVNSLFFIFIVIQLAYLFGGEQSLIAQGFTYAGYARKGFFELIAVSVLSFGLLFLTEKFSARLQFGHYRMFKILSAGLIAQVFIVMLSASKRLFLYEQAYGFSTIRLYSHVFMLFIAVIFCLLLYKIYKDAREQSFAFRSFVVVCLFLAGMNLLNPDAYIAKQNIGRYTVSGEVDLTYLNQLSSDAIPVTVSLLDHSDQEIRTEYAGLLYKAFNSGGVHSEEFSFKDWQSYNLSRASASDVYKLRKNELEEIILKKTVPSSASGEVVSYRK